MKRLLTLMLLMASFLAGAQIPGFIPYKSKNQHIGLAADSLMYIPVKDTTHTPVRLGALTFRSSDSSIYIGVSTTAGTKRWARLAKYSELSGAQTWQQTLITGSTLTQNNTINGGGYYLDFSMNGGDFGVLGADLISLSGNYNDGLVIQGGLTRISTGISTNWSAIQIGRDSISIEPHLGNLIIDTLNSGASTDSVLVWTASTGQVKKRNVAAIGSGTVTSFSAGNLSPLFTTSVATATTTPALTFSLSSAGAYTNFGNRTGSSAAPTFFTNPFIDSLKRSTDSVFGRVNGSWIFQFKDSVGSGGGGSPGGSDKQIQYNNSGSFGGATGFEFGNTNQRVRIESQSSTEVGLIVRGHSSYTPNIAEFQSSAGTYTLAWIGPSGQVYSLQNITAFNGASEQVQIGYTNLAKASIAFGASSDTYIAKSGTSALIATTNGTNTNTSIQSLYDRFGSGSPEGVVTAPVGAVYHRTDGGAGTSFYVKESGSGNTGWVAK